MARAAAHALERTLATTTGADVLLDAVPRHLQALIGCGPTFIATVDPVTLHFVRAARSDISDEVSARFLSYEVGVPDVVKFRALATARDPVDALFHATDGRPEASARWRDVIEPLGWGDELRVAIRQAGRTWGVLCLHREADDPPFGDEDVAAIRAVMPQLATAFRRTSLPADTPSPAAMPAPGVVVLNDQMVITSVTGAAAEWLGVLGGGRSGLPMSIMSAAVHTTLSGEPQSLVTVTGDGGWLSVHTAAMRGSGSDAVAVVLQAAHPHDALPMLAAAVQLTPRETEVAAAVLRGLSDRAVARSLGVSEHTVQDHLKRVYAKTNVRSRTELIARLLLP